MRSRHLPRERSRHRSLVRLARDRDHWVSRIAPRGPGDRRTCRRTGRRYAVRRLESIAYDHAGLCIRTLWHSPGEVIGPVLAHIDDVDTIDVAELISFRVTEGLETVDADLFVATCRWRPRRGRRPVRGLRASRLRHARHSRSGARRRRPRSARRPSTRRHGTGPTTIRPRSITPRRREIVDAITEAVTSDPPRSVVLVGEHGVGKTALVRAALDQLPESWSAFEATASSVNAGAMYIGQLEGRVEEIVTALRDKRDRLGLPRLPRGALRGNVLVQSDGPARRARASHRVRRGEDRRRDLPDRLRAPDQGAAERREPGAGRPRPAARRRRDHGGRSPRARHPGDTRSSSPTRY